jgi:hypothetical protein
LVVSLSRQRPSASLSTLLLQLPTDSHTGTHPVTQGPWPPHKTQHTPWSPGRWPAWQRWVRSGRPPPPAPAGAPARSAPRPHLQAGGRERNTGCSARPEGAVRWERTERGGGGGERGRCTSTLSTVATSAGSRGESRVRLGGSECGAGWVAGCFQLPLSCSYPPHIQYHCFW